MKVYTYSEARQRLSRERFANKALKIDGLGLAAFHKSISQLLELRHRSTRPVSNFI